MTTSVILTEDQIERIKPHLIGWQSISQFVYAATFEKINRMEKRDERARRQNLKRDINAIREPLEAILREKGFIE